MHVLALSVPNGNYSFHILVVDLMMVKKNKQQQKKKTINQGLVWGGDYKIQLNWENVLIKLKQNITQKILD